jgi:Flp pilus assembly protein TadD
MAKKTKHKVQPRNLTTSRDIERWLERATQQLIASDYAGVIATAQRVLRAPLATSDQRLNGLHRLGAAYAMLQQHEACHAAVTAALEIAPNDPLLWYNLGMAARFMLRLGESLNAFERAAELDTTGVLAERLAQDLPFARSAVATELALRGPDFTLDQLIVQEALFDQAVATMAQRRWIDAEHLFRQVIAMGDGLPQPHGNLGLCMVMQGRFDEAEMALRRALSIDPAYELARQNLARLPAMRATGKPPAFRIDDPMKNRKGKQTLSLLIEGGQEPGEQT